MSLDLPALSRLKDGVELAFDCEGTPEEDENGKPIPGGGFGRTGDIPLTQQEHIEPFVLSGTQVDDCIGNNITPAVGWPSSPTMNNQADTAAADWSGKTNNPQDGMGPTVVASTDTAAKDWDIVPTTDHVSWEYMLARETTFTEFGK
ncbi:hypothetical protein BOTCAL_0630g00040 [Botryotinia calthae]|uniref:Uncharacterized protein n=1 Tax=Botryotinia calthae TaxID=38488 RepID=A0A4Y8CIC1_9HELO|nr:hypothetical protein BOTCAL_0630g00040 [Botryotinia calthae]